SPMAVARRPNNSSTEPEGCVVVGAAVDEVDTEASYVVGAQATELAITSTVNAAERVLAFMVAWSLRR
ncbi:MAG: hypothetical protein ACKPBG_05110, partial [Actinomycetota bacterium]